MEAVIADVMTQAQGVLLNLTGQQIDGPVALALVVVALNSIVLLAFRFGLNSKTQVLGLPIGKHIHVSYDDENGKEVGRPYTPTSSDDDLGYVDFVIKVYYAGVNPRFPDGGQLSQYLDKLKIGDSMMFKGPTGRVTYKGCGTFEKQLLKHEGGGVQIRDAKKVGMIAGGTGITPMLQLMRAMFKDPKDTTEVWLIFANQTEEDILVRKELEECQAQNPGRFHLWYTVDRPPADWKYDSGFIGEEMCRKHLPPPGPDTQICVCGPPPMIKFAIKPAFEKIGHPESNTFYW